MDARGRGGDFLRLSVPSSDAALKHLLIRECLPMNGRSEEQPRLLSRRRVLSPMNQHYQVLPTVSIYAPGGRQGVASSGLASTRRAFLFHLYFAIGVRPRLIESRFRFTLVAPAK